MDERYVITTFISSPSDAQVYRTIVHEVCKEISDLWGDSLHFHLKSLDFKTCIHPDAGKYPQGVINKQLIDKYDIIICIFNESLGTPTPLHRSGTIEELENALKEKARSERFPIIMVYFKRHNDTRILTESIAEFTEFRKYISEKDGLLYGSFQDETSFKYTVRSDLSLAVNSILASSITVTERTQTTVPEREQEQAMPNSDPSIEARFNELINESNIQLEICADKLEVVVVAMEQFAQDVLNLNDRIESNDSLGSVKGFSLLDSVYSDLADHQVAFSRKMKSELPEIRESFENGLIKFSQIFALLIGYDATLHDLTEPLNHLGNIRDSIVEARDGVSFLCNSIEVCGKMLGINSPNQPSRVISLISDQTRVSYTASYRELLRNVAIYMELFQEMYQQITKDSTAIKQLIKE